MPESQKSLRELVKQAVEDRGICDTCPGGPLSGHDAVSLWPEVGIQPSGAVLAIPALWRLNFYDRLMERDPEMARGAAEIDPIIQDLLRERAKTEVQGEPDAK